MQADIEYDPEEDWLDDNKGLPDMAWPNFFDALFELADMWWVMLGTSSTAHQQLMGSLLAGC